MARPTMARAWSKPPRSFVFPTGPGRKIEFRGGEAFLFDEFDILPVLRREDMIFSPDPRYIDWLPEWLGKCGDRSPPLAEIQLPEGFSLERIENGTQSAWLLQRPKTGPDARRRGGVALEDGAPAS